MAVMLHSVILSRKAELDQLSDGLGSLLCTVRDNREICKPLFVQEDDNNKVTKEKMMSLLVFTDQLSEQLKKFFIDYIEMKGKLFMIYCKLYNKKRLRLEKVFYAHAAHAPMVDYF